ncbi:MAG: phage integrase SAM-like domain-containing protein [Niabella sp.]
MQVLTKAVLWTYYTRKDGLFTVKVRMTNFKVVEYVKTDMACHPDNWDEENGVPLPEHPEYYKLTERIKEIKDEIAFEIKLAQKNQEAISLSVIKDKIEKKDQKKVVKKMPSTDIWKFYDDYIAELEKAGSCGSADLFTDNKKIFKSLFDNKSKTFASFSKEDFEKIDNFIKKLKTESTKSIYLRTFYRIWNLAIEKGINPRDHHPKFHISFRAYKRIRTKKRAAPIEVIPKINKLEFAYESRLFRSLMLAKFMYYARGINFKDTMLLKHDVNVKNGYLKYKRSKNGREYDYKLHPEAIAVVEIMKDYPMQSDAGYVFPILDSTHDTARKIHTRKNSALKDFNEDLVTIEESTSCPAHLTSYVLRHSVLSHLKRKKVAIGIIKEVAGHETELQTNVYLEDIEDGIIAEEIENVLPV